MKDQRILVTGSAGFIGSNIANTLASENDVIGIDDCFLGDQGNLSDAVDFKKMCVLEDDLPTDVDTVFHLAALSSYAMHEDDTCKGVRVNIEGFVNVVEQARTAGCTNIVYASTSSIYGNQTEPSPEGMSVEANTGYEASKLARERYAQYFSNHYDMTLSGLRFFSVYEGYGGSEGHKGEFANVVSQFADDIAKNESPVLYGDGTQTRDFTHVNDVVRAAVLAAEHELDGVYNVGTGSSYTFNEVVKLINNEFNTDIKPNYVENPVPESVYVTDTCADHSKLTEATGWEPVVNFKDGIRRVCKAYSNSK